MELSTIFSISVALIFNPISLILYFMAYDFLRSIFPTQEEKRALDIINDDKKDIIYVSVTHDFRDDKRDLLSLGISRLNEKIKENNQKVNTLNVGLRRISSFSKSDKKKRVNDRIKVLEEANQTMQRNSDAAMFLRNKMEQYQMIYKAQLGGQVTFGNHCWTVVKRDSESLLLLCSYVLDAKFDYGGWSNGCLRQACQSMYPSFDCKEKELMMVTSNETKNENGIAKDYLFVLSPEQLTDLPNPSLIIKAEWSDNAIHELHDYIYDWHEGYAGRLEKTFNGKYTYNYGWWLRSSEEETAYVNPDGCIKICSASQGLDICGFRPAVWVSIR